MSEFLKDKETIDFEYLKQRNRERVTQHRERKKQRLENSIDNEMREISSNSDNNRISEDNHQEATFNLIQDNNDNFCFGLNEEENCDETFISTLESNEDIDSTFFKDYESQKKYLYPNSKIAVRDFLSGLFTLKYFISLVRNVLTTFYPCLRQLFLSLITVH